MTRGATTSAGLLMYRRRDGEPEVFLVHPGGPFFKNKDNGFRSIPKGEVGEGEDVLGTAKREFLEETRIAIPPDVAFADLGSVVQRSGKRVHAFAFEHDAGNVFHCESEAEIEWPPRSGKKIRVPEVDRGEYFFAAAAAEKINEAQRAFLERLSKLL